MSASKWRVWALTSGRWEEEVEEETGLSLFYVPHGGLLSTSLFNRENDSDLPVSDI